MRQTTWLGNQVQQAVESGMSVLISSLTKAAATEIGGRNLPISFDALGTLHSHCYHALGKPEIAEGREHLQQWNEDEPEYRLSLGSNDLGEKIDGDNLEPARETAGDELMETRYAGPGWKPSGCPPGCRPTPSGGATGRKPTG